MKKIINKLHPHRSLLLCSLFIFHSVLATELPTPIYIIYSDSKAPCYSKNCSILGLDVELNYGYSWLTLGPHRPNEYGLYPLSKNFVKENEDSFLAALAYDFYPCLKFPLRLQLNYFYTDSDFELNPLFLLNCQQSFKSKEQFLVRNTMLTLYFDWHTCTSFVPYAGISAGVANLKTYHTPDYLVTTGPLTSIKKQSHLSVGGTIGARYFFNNYMYANAQLRYNDLGSLSFSDHAPTKNPVGQSTHFLSDYLHETTVLLGIGFVF